MTRRDVLMFGAAALPLPARSSEFWNRKQPSEWSEREIDRLLTKSPWAKEVTAEVPLRATGGFVAQNQFPTPRGGSGIPGLGGRFPGAGWPGSGEGRGRTSAGRERSRITCVVRWESAAPVLEAMGVPLPSAFAGHYVLGAGGLPRGPADEEAIDKLRTRLKQTTVLRVSGRTNVRPELVQLLPGVTTRGFLFGFSKEAHTVAASDRTVEFVTDVEGVKLNAVFEPGAMTYRGELAV
jgi:hypothetical protein